MAPPHARALRALALGAAAAAVLAAGAASATPDGRVIRYAGGGQGRVVFDARVHEKAGLVCKDCHADAFPTRKTGLVSRADHDQRRRCFACHDGARAFVTCDRCHAR